MIASPHTPFSAKTWQVPHFFDHLPSPLLVLSCPALFRSLLRPGRMSLGLVHKGLNCLWDCSLRVEMPLGLVCKGQNIFVEAEENESPTIIQEANVLSFSCRSPWYIIISKGKLTYCKLLPFHFG